MDISHGRLTNMPRKNISVKSNDVKEEQKVDPTIELLKELIKVNQEIKEILLQLKNRFI